jgi:hypothetical protein
MGYCPDCGGRTSSGVCSNCQEELYILNEQSEWLTEGVSEEFAAKATEQKEELRRRERLKRTI